LGQALDHPDAAVRLQIVQLLPHWGYQGAIGLSRAGSDTDEGVRAAAQAALVKLGIEVCNGAIIRGPADQRQIALVFAGHEFAEGGETILDELARHKAQASFFLTGEFLRNAAFRTVIERLYREGHYLGPHSDQYLLYLSSPESKQSLITREQFDEDFTQNLNSMHRLASFWPIGGYFLPPREQYNLEIAEWAKHYFFATISSTPGTLSSADCTKEGDTAFVSSKAIFDSIVAREQQDVHGLNGFLLLLHVGSGPGRADKFHNRLGGLLEYLTSKGYQFVTVDDMFEPRVAAERRTRIGEPSADWQESEAFRRLSTGSMQQSRRRRSAGWVPAG
jgi:peptidoglycan/xylan/chitin deacetylase (PgdA/CDA1 family)